MTTNDADKPFADAIAWAQRTGRARDLRDVLERLHRDLADDPVALAQIRTLLDRIQASSAVEAPSAWVQTATTRIVELEAAARAATGPGFIDRARSILREVARVVEAQLVGDTFAGQALQGIRGSTALQPRQLHFVSELGDVHIQVDRTDRGHSVMGQFVPSQEDLLDIAMEARATTSDGSTTVDLDPGAQFSFTNVQDGEIRIELSLGKESLNLAPFWIRSRQKE